MGYIQLVIGVIDVTYNYFLDIGAINLDETIRYIIYFQLLESVGYLE